MPDLENCLRILIIFVEQNGQISDYENSIKHSLQHDTRWTYLYLRRQSNLFQVGCFEICKIKLQNWWKLVVILDIPKDIDT